jgi:hypothetical protein
MSLSVCAYVRFPVMLSMHASKDTSWSNLTAQEESHKTSFGLATSLTSNIFTTAHARARPQLFSLQLPPFLILVVVCQLAASVNNKPISSIYSSRIGRTLLGCRTALLHPPSVVLVLRTLPDVPVVFPFSTRNGWTNMRQWVYKWFAHVRSFVNLTDLVQLREATVCCIRMGYTSGHMACVSLVDQLLNCRAQFIMREGEGVSRAETYRVRHVLMLWLLLGLLCLRTRTREHHPRLQE